MNLEQSTAEAILEKKTEIKIADKTYLVTKPSYATLILLSEFISQLPVIDAESDEDLLKLSLREAKNAKYIGEMLAILVLGAKGSEPYETTEKITKEVKSVLGNRQIEVDEQKIVYPAKELGEVINNELDLEEIFNLFFSLLKDLKIVFFSQIITFLSGVNLTKKTK